MFTSSKVDEVGKIWDAGPGMPWPPMAESGKGWACCRNLRPASPTLEFVDPTTILQGPIIGRTKSCSEILNHYIVARQSNGQRCVGSKIVPAYLSYLTKFARGRPSGFSSFFGFATCKFFGSWVHASDLTPTGVPGSKILQTSQGLWSTPTWTTWFCHGMSENELIIPTN